MRLLALETSCDETSAAVLEGSGDQVALRSLVILSQDVHRVFGGVVPEIASRQHLTAVLPVTERALADAGLALDDIEGIAVTHAPGLVGALLVGVSFAKALAAARGVPLVGVHHMEGHLFATALEHPDAVPPFVALLVSGGHTMLVDVERWGAYRLLGATRDDAAGEAFDKVAKLLGLPYPGGRHVERLARDGEPGRFRFAPPMVGRGERPGDADWYDVSFSGLKTAVRREVRALEQAGAMDDGARAALCRAFQQALVTTLATKVARAAEALGRDRVVLGGGVACNGALADAVRGAVAARGVRVFTPSPRLATDNAAMIGRAGLFRLEAGHRDGPSLNAFASRPLPGLQVAARRDDEAAE